MSKQRKENPIGRRKPKSVGVTGREIPDPKESKNRDFDGDGVSDDKDEDVSVETTDPSDFNDYNPNEDKPMLKRLLTSKIAKGIGSVLGGALGFGGSIFAGLDPEFAVVVAATAVIAIFMGMDKAAKFKGLFDEDLNDNQTGK